MEKASAAERYAASLERAIAAARELTHEERALGEIRSGRLGEVTAGERQRILALAGERDLVEAMKDEEEALAEQRARAAREAEEAARRHAGAAEEIASAALALATPYERAIAEIERWRESVLARLDEAGEGHEAYAERVAEVNRIAAEKSARAWEAESERRLRSSKRWEDGVIRGLRRVAEEAGDYASAMEEATVRAFGKMEDALVEFATTGELSFKDLANSIIADLARIAIRESITGPLAEGLEGVLGKLFGGGVPGTISGGVGLGLPPFAAGVGHEGGVAGRLGGRRRLVSPELFAHAPRHHRGGIAGQLRPARSPSSPSGARACSPPSRWPRSGSRASSSTSSTRARPSARPARKCASTPGAGSSR